MNKEKGGIKKRERGMGLLQISKLLIKSIGIKSFKLKIKRFSKVLHLVVS